MKRPELIPITLLAGLGAFVISTAMRVPAATSAEPEYHAASLAVPAGEPIDETVTELRSGSLVEMDEDNSEDVRRRIRMGQAGTYINEILLARDSALARWPDRTREPLRVWVQPHSDYKGWKPVFASLAREAFTDWADTGIPVRFSFVLDSTRADIRLSWTDSFEEPINGRTRWARDERWWIVEGDIVIALQQQNGSTLESAAIKAITLHEIGHMLGLDHTDDFTAIMTPRVMVRGLAPTDRATVRLLYTLPPGSIR